MRVRPVLVRAAALAALLALSWGCKPQLPAGGAPRQKPFSQATNAELEASRTQARRELDAVAARIASMQRELLRGNKEGPLLKKAQGALQAAREERSVLANRLERIEDELDRRQGPGPAKRSARVEAAFGPREGAVEFAPVAPGEQKAVIAAILRDGGRDVSPEASVPAGPRNTFAVRLEDPPSQAVPVATPVPVPVALPKMRVTRVRAGDFLILRSEARADSLPVAKIAPNATGLQPLDLPVENAGTQWVLVEFAGLEGFVNAYYLQPVYAMPAAGPGDVPPR